MKKIINSLVFLFVLLLLQSCNTEDKDILTEENTLSLNQKMLSFNSVHAYSDIFDNYNEQKFNTLVNSSSFASLKRAKLDKTSNSKLVNYVEEDDLDYKIYDLINEDGFINLGSYTLRLDLITKTVFVSEYSDEKTIENMRLGNDSYEGIFTLPFSYDVVELLELCEENNTKLAEGIELHGTSNNLRAACPAASGRNDARENCNDLDYSYNDEAYSAKVKLEYEKFGIYFAVKSKVKNYIISNATGVCNPHRTGFQSIRYIRCDINKKKKVCRWFNCDCKNDWQYNWAAAGVTVAEGSTNDQNSEDFVTSHKAYESTRGLQAYSVSVLITYSPTSGTTGSKSKTLSISDNM
jgi:hypothetical protein